MRIFPLLVGVFTAAVPAQGPSFKAGVRLVRLDVSVLGSDRQPIPDLTAGDFRVTERGRPLAIRTFDVVAVPGSGVPPAVAPAIEGGRLATPARQAIPTPPASAPDLGTGRLIVLVMDDDMTPGNPKWGTQARTIARSMVERMGPAVEQMFVDTSVYYVLAVEPRDATPDDRFHEVRVEVDRPDVEVRARPGYYYTR